jgi:hypothetical protein
MAVILEETIPNVSFVVSVRPFRAQHCLMPTALKMTDQRDLAAIHVDPPSRQVTAVGVRALLLPGQHDRQRVVVQDMVMI